jgi:3-oxoacyl-[acyl-carrier protein] reductase
VALEIDLSGRVALVTGGSRGLGRADALTLARAGADVVIADIQLESDAGEDVARYGPLAQAARAQGLVYSEATAREIMEMGRRAAATKCDVTSRGDVEATVARVVEELGSLDILVNNAGTLDHVAQLGDQSPELWERDLLVNLTGAFNCAQAVWPHMRERGWGRIVNMASVAGTLGGFGQASYSTTKAGLLGLTKTLALEADGDAARRRAAGRRERDRVSLLGSGVLHHRRRAQRQRRHRAIHLLRNVRSPG